MAKGVFLMIVFMFPLQWFDETYARWTEDSLVAPYLEDWVDDIRENAQADQKEQLKEKTSALTSTDSPPQDDYTKKDREALDKILNDIADK